MRASRDGRRRLAPPLPTCFEGVGGAAYHPCGGCCDPEVLRRVGARLSELCGPAGQAGPEAMASWPDPIPGLAARLYAAGVPTFGRWLFDNLYAGV